MVNRFLHKCVYNILNGRLPDLYKPLPGQAAGG